MKRLWAMCVALMVWVGVAIAQEGATPAASDLVKASAGAVKLTPGATATVKVRLDVLNGWHINANPPALDYNIPTTVTIAAGHGVAAGKPKYPAPKKQKFAFEDSELFVWDGATEVTLPLTASATAENGTHTLKGTVAYQGCNDQVCLAPTKVPFTVDVTVTGGVEPGAEAIAAAANPDSAVSSDTLADSGAGGAEPSEGFTTAMPEGGENAPPPATGAAQGLQDALGKGGLWWFLALFLGGLALNLTPCVFPMLGITVSIFGARRKEPLPKVLTNAVVYVLGICVTYSALGVVAGLTGGLFGQALQNPLVNVGLGLLLVALSLSMFGVYEMQAPTWVLDKVGGANTGSIAGLFVSGLAVGVIAAPCVGPFVVALLAIIAQKGSALFGLQAMFTLSLGLGFPYLFLAAFSSLLQTLPKSGDWMDWIKKFFGVLLASMGLYYALIGVAPKLAAWILPAALMLGGLYLGFMEKSANARPGFKALKRVGGTLAVIAGVWFVLQLTTMAARTIVFRPYSEAALQSSLAAGRPVLIDFSANWCVPCHELELQTFPDKAVVAAARDFDAYVVDLTHYDSAEAEGYRKKFGITGVPTIVFVAKSGAEVREARVEGFMGPAEFVKRLEKVKGAS
ncbi:MAG: thioredoxin fold domain-containing protein [Candidatus Eisenbacteria bacterium]|uniref:Thioredoxin fold domain-containing protein n=1 Tax=Eiseniibacteriota bacterium TaxID=2212470 RepID=A0A933SAM4_UNCEI|nr:thioredoxin fold domain-containing protein [Candidatus Eisenbacteria bacterium]